MATVNFYVTQKKETQTGLEQVNDKIILIFVWTIPLMYSLNNIPCDDQEHLRIFQI